MDVETVDGVVRLDGRDELERAGGLQVGQVGECQAQRTELIDELISLAMERRVGLR
mgnify:CR=1 FL=1